MKLGNLANKWDVIFHWTT